MTNDTVNIMRKATEQMVDKCFKMANNGVGSFIRTVVSALILLLLFMGQDHLKKIDEIHETVKKLKDKNADTIMLDDMQAFEKRIEELEPKLALNGTIREIVKARKLNELLNIRGNQ